jgi:hypothetical protein
MKKHNNHKTEKIQSLKQSTKTNVYLEADS